jgi:hypothetical protein
MITKFIDDLLSRPGVLAQKNFGMAGYSKRAVLAYLKDFFSDERNTKDFGSEEGQFVYYPGSDDPTQNGSRYPEFSLQITDRYSYDQKDRVDPRPKLVVIRGPMRRMPRSIGGGLAEVHVMRAVSERRTVKELSMQIIAMSRQGDEAERLADIVFESMNAFSTSFTKLLGWENIEALSIEPESAVDIDVNPDFIAVPISLSGTILSNYIIKRDAPQYGGLHIDKIPKVITPTGKEIKFS